MAIGICNAVYPCDVAGNVAAPPLAPAAPTAVSVFFDINPAIATPPQDQLDLKRDVERMLHALTKLFLVAGKVREASFRPYYVQLLRLAQLGLSGPNAAPDMARRALEGMTADLIDNEGGTVKNAHMAKLAKWAAWFSVPFLAGYAILCFTTAQQPLGRWLATLNINRMTLACFMLLWVGCFFGVVLSYGARTTTMTLNDLVTVDADHWLPQVRLLFAGTMTMVLGAFLIVGIVEFKLGSSISTSELSTYPLIAFLIGAMCGLSELTLPGAVSKKATGLLDFK